MVTKTSNNERTQTSENEMIARPEGQFMKSIMLDTPNSPTIFSLMKEPPGVDVQCNVDAKTIDEKNGIYEVTLDIKTEANVVDKEDDKKNDANLAFICKLKYCGIFTIQNLTDTQKEQALFIEAPTLLFPFARRIIATATTDAGFPPLMLSPLNFAEQYLRNKENKKS